MSATLTLFGATSLISAFCVAGWPWTFWEFSRGDNLDWGVDDEEGKPHREEKQTQAKMFRGAGSEIETDPNRQTHSGGGKS